MTSWLGIFGGLSLLGLLQFITSLWISERLKTSLQQETNEVLEKLRWDFKIREQGAKVAEYMALARNLRHDSSEEDYREANRLAWELAMWLPADVYRALAQALATPTEQFNPLTVTIQVRKILLGNSAGDLTSEHILQHAPGIGEQRS